MQPLAEKYLRKSALPSIFCPGCGDGTILGSMLRVIDDLGLGNFCFVSGIGCSGWIPVFINADAIHSLHGRAIPTATGLKMALPEKHVVIFTGDGDCLGIGGNHFIHAARRNVDLTVVMVNNYIYGMTGGQVAPTTPLDMPTKTTPYGNSDQPFDAAKLAIGAGATFVARHSVPYPKLLDRDLKKAILHKGFSFIEVVAQCPTQSGRIMYGSSEPAVLFDEIKKRSVTGKDQPLAPGQFAVGILHEDSEKKPYEPSRPRGEEQ
jgi:2-oxoglutarate ferredoxin oxidoreductase subunit beta